MVDQAGKTGMAPGISAVICTRDRVARLEHCIESLLDQSLARDAYEILIVDNGSTDGTAELAKRYCAKHGVRYVYEAEPGLSLARNAAVRESATEYIGYIDDDATAVPAWLETALSCFKRVEPSPDWVGGPIDLEWETEPAPWLHAGLRVALGEVYWGDAPHELAVGERLGGGNSFYRRELLEGLGGFDERLGRRGELLLSGEETQLQQRVQDAGGKLYYHPGVRIRHHVPLERMSPGWFYHRCYWGGYTDMMIRRTLDGRPCTVGMNSTPPEVGRTRIGRLLRNLFRATGLTFDAGQTVSGRVYIAYVFGWLCASLRKP